ncbi:SMC-Scp complex subunit ScpB [Kribbella sp. NPDC051770]|uniref:SMC-Scp complex subunit ScpB n=1 Tax=Kribbella sp. NPDC051770 TaxID=3155413 RepID=UPI00341F2202
MTDSHPQPDPATADALDSVTSTEQPVEQHDEPMDDVQAEDANGEDAPPADAAQVPAADEESDGAEELLLQPEEEPGAGEVVIDDVRAEDTPAEDAPADDGPSGPADDALADDAPGEDVPPADASQVPAADEESGGAEELLLQLEEEPAAGEEVIDDVAMRQALEAILMVTDEPLPALVLARAVGRALPDVTAALKELAGEYTEQGRGFDLREVGGGWRYYTRPAQAQYVEKFVLDGQQARLTQAALETLAVVAYKQPVSRARVSAIRGVNVDGVMRTLISRGLVEDAGADTESQATLYRTSSYFLERMGMQSLDDLPELAPYLPEMDDVEEELAAQNTTIEDVPGTPDGVATPEPDEAVTSDVGAAGIDGDLSTEAAPQLDLEHGEQELEPAEELEAGGETELDQEEADPAEIPEIGGAEDDTDSDDDDSDDDADSDDDDDDGSGDDSDDSDDDDEDDLDEDDLDDEDDDLLEPAEELTGETGDVRLDDEDDLAGGVRAADGVPADGPREAGGDSAPGAAQYRSGSDD